ncbi:radical SAM protein [Tissierella pigra]|uniref:radical SAM/SPASM domain-containing protein n=1 Tax=Tissierella pigra TaxID=2607614 RepID=UPI001C10BD30|nr:radical SAM protein [Tissierella pigra]MBU5427240.1 radical SAM protein [Tissierella pigra]
MYDNRNNCVYFENIISRKVLSVDFFNKRISIAAKNPDMLDSDNVINGKPETDVKEYLDSIRANHKNAVFGIVTTFDCNLSCKYCYEKSFRSERCTLNKQLSKDICNYIIKYLKYYKSEVVKVIFTGGEPTLNMDAIMEIANFLRLNLNKMDIEFSFSIVTNGTIDISKYFQDLKELGLDLIQISLDGSKKMHNSRRVSNFDAHERTIKLINKCADSGIRTLIRTNIDKENIKDFDNMLLEIKELAQKDVVLSLYQTEKTLCERTSEHNNVFELDIIIKAFSLATKHGFKVNKHNPFFGGCMSLVPIGQFIDPFGNIYKCGGMLGHKNEILGSIYDFDLVLSATNEYIDRKLDDECMECKLFPICTGGCIYNRYFTKHCDDIFKKRMYEKAKLELLLYLLEKNILRFPDNSSNG